MDSKNSMIFPDGDITVYLNRDPFFNTYEVVAEAWKDGDGNLKKFRLAGDIKTTYLAGIISSAIKAEITKRKTVENVLRFFEYGGQE